jgi:hypothetical protein
VRLPAHYLYSETICLKCVANLGYTGCAFLTLQSGEQQPMEFILGTARPPKGWSGRRSTPEEILRALSSPGYTVPDPPKDVERIDIAATLAQFEWVEVREAGEAA